MRTIHCIVATLVFGIVAASAAAAVRTVGPAGSGADFETFQAAINAAGDGDIVEAFDGTYTGAANRDIDFLGKAITVRSQNGPENCIIDCQGADSDHHRGFDFHSGETNSSVLQGLTIRNGYAQPAGGIHCFYSSPTISNCRIVGNRAGEGGGFAAFHSTAILTHSTVSQNVAFGYHSGGILLDDCNITISNCSITANETIGLWRYEPSPHGLSGGGLAFWNSVVNVTDCLFAGNRCTEDGAAIYSRTSTGLISGNTFVGNVARTAGGAVDLHGTGQDFIGNLVVSNTAGFEAGGVRIHWSDGVEVSGNVIVGNHAPSGGGLTANNTQPATLANNLVAGNTADRGGGIYVHPSNPDLWIDNTTFASNQACYGCGIYSESPVPPQVRNCVFWGSDFCREQIFTSQSVDVTYCDVQGGYAGKGNVDADPLFLGGPGGVASGCLWTAEPVYDEEAFQTVLTGGSWEPGELAGKCVNPDRWQHLQFYIVDNDETTLIVWGDATEVADMGDAFQIHDYHLGGASPCLDAAADAGLYEDLAGNWRPIDFPGVDNNGPLDEFDMGCYEVLPGDASLDGCVDGGDYTLWADHYLQPAGWEAGDYNGDEWVDGADYTIWADNYLIGCGGDHIPEPASSALIALGTAAIALGRRRRRGPKDAIWSPRNLARSVS